MYIKAYFEFHGNIYLQFIYYMYLLTTALKLCIDTPTMRTCVSSSQAINGSKHSTAHRKRKRHQVFIGENSELERAFQSNPTFSQTDVKHLAETLSLPQNYIENWYLIRLLKRIKTNE